MIKQKYKLNEGEKIVFKAINVKHVKHGFLETFIGDSYSNILIITNQGIILEKYGTFENFKGIQRYSYNDINQAIQTKSYNGSNTLEIYMENKIEEFQFYSDDENVLRILVKSISDQMGPDAELYDFQYYQDLLNGIKDEERLLKLRELVDDENSKTNLGFAGNAVKNIIKSGNFSVGGIAKGISKATTKRNSGFIDEILEDIGARDIQDGFTEIGNGFREVIGLRPKITNAERKELQELEKKRRKKEFIQEKASNKNEKINEQLELLRKTKELLDAGILTEEEFEIKKREIMQF